MQKYYQNDFHFQTDGWFSSKSAQVYEMATESLFAGCQDAMQRSTLAQIGECAFSMFFIHKPEIVFGKCGSLGLRTFQLFMSQRISISL
jgi:hypothetical protein